MVLSYGEDIKIKIDSLYVWVKSRCLIDTEHEATLDAWTHSALH